MATGFQIASFQFNAFQIGDAPNLSNLCGKFEINSGETCFFANSGESVIDISGGVAEMDLQAVIYDIDAGECC